MPGWRAGGGGRGVVWMPGRNAIVMSGAGGRAGIDADRLEGRRAGWLWRSHNEISNDVNRLHWAAEGYGRFHLFRYLRHIIRYIHLLRNKWKHGHIRLRSPSLVKRLDFPQSFLFLNPILFLHFFSLYFINSGGKTDWTFCREKKTWKPKVNTSNF